MTPFADKLRALRNPRACPEAIAWVGDRTAEAAWAECGRGDWMAWLVARLCDRKAVVLCLCEVARTVLHLVPAGDDRTQNAVETAEAWVRGKATIEQVREAAGDAYAAIAAARSAAAAASAAAAYAAAASAAAAYAAYAAVYVAAEFAASAASAAYAAAYAAYASASAANRSMALARVAAIVRRHFPACPLADGTRR